MTSWISEMDLLLGAFADAHMEDMGEHDLAEFEALMELPDHALYARIVGRAPPADTTPSPMRLRVLSTATTPPAI